MLFTRRFGILSLFQKNNLYINKYESLTKAEIRKEMNKRKTDNSSNVLLFFHNNSNHNYYYTSTQTKQLPLDTSKRHYTFLHNTKNKNIPL